MAGQFTSETGAAAARKRHEESRKSPVCGRRIHRSTSLVQALEIQSVLFEQFLTIASLPPDSHELKARRSVVDSLCKLARAWADLTALLRDIRGQPRAGTLSAAERAQAAERRRMRRRAPRSPRPVRNGNVFPFPQVPSVLRGADGSVAGGPESHEVPPLPDAVKPADGSSEG